MATFTMDYSVNIVPKETNTLSDGADTVVTIDSNIDKIIGSSILSKALGTDATRIKYDATYTTTTTTSTGWNSIIGSSPSNVVKFLFMRIISAGSSGTPTVHVVFDDGVNPSNQLAYLSGVGDWFLLPINANEGATYTSDEFKVYSPSAATVANVETLLILGDEPS